MVRAWMEEEEESRNEVGTKMDVLMDNSGLKGWRLAKWGMILAGEGRHVDYNRTDT